ncbi:MULTISPECIES: enoyl-CoA hydratase-related protein [unclassified Sporosarcina]|uniref:enoyl-CoA hydratase-related protein n=1 Tax=unclassified Sporosarcina TaxID=2647733 RepID=UPI002041CFB6|nr:MULTISPECIES: enoyl-CoA hydratase-related protein [unclassified Sporosarcina]GKV64875.1 putative enoyl-CoA hydratase/isomerase YngF [Sporosarcina sp. NCCP-2331]GLB54985.1 putative enoyl-CoA hydratase/isomerase YngF [Sporosarcina sp. NCCP-2378]
MQDIQYEQRNSVAYITLNRPEAMNAFNFNLLMELGQVVEGIRIDPDIRAVVITGSGDRAFSVGADLKERKLLTETQVRRNLNKIGDVFTMIDQLPQPTISLINGFAFGGGMELALACDFRIAANEAVMGLTETGLAIIPGAGGTQRLPRLIGEAKALELIMTARRLDAEEAFAYGLLTQRAPADLLEEVADAFVASLLANGPIALQQAKFAIKQGMNVDLQTGLAIERKAYEMTLPTEDRMEALNAFAEKRKPVFKGR